MQKGFLKCPTLVFCFIILKIMNVMLLTDFIVKGFKAFTWSIVSTPSMYVQ